MSRDKRGGARCSVPAIAADLPRRPDWRRMTTAPDPLPEDLFLKDFLGAMGLDAALRLGLVDRLLAGGALPQGPSGATLAALLEQAGVLRDGQISASFRAVLASRRGILEQKLAFLRRATLDVTRHLDLLLTDLPAFMAESETFALFRYDKAMTVRPEDVAATRLWVDYVTALSEAEAPSLVPHIPLSGVSRLLEVGGNTGVMARALLDTNPDLRAVILDLPAVCALGEARGAHPRLAFHPGDARAGDWPLVAGAPAEAVLFKSVLHDWPDGDALGLLDKALSALPSGGRIIICERGPLAHHPMPYAMTANLVFAPFYRDPGLYEGHLRGAGCRVERSAPIPLDMPFHVVTGTKP